MSRPYVQRSRRRDAAETRRRILQAARELLPGGSEVRVVEIAAQAGVSIQTLYTHFGSKSGLLMAMVDDLQRERGLEAGFRAVWASPDAESALRAMVQATFTFWDRAWPYIEFMLRGRRTDPIVREQVAGRDVSRHGHLVTLCTRLEAEGRLRRDLDPGRAADLAFALTAPTVYEELVVVRAWGLPEATAAVADTVATAVIERADAVIG